MPRSEGVSRPRKDLSTTYPWPHYHFRLFATFPAFANGTGHFGLTGMRRGQRGHDPAAYHEKISQSADCHIKTGFIKDVSLLIVMIFGGKPR